MEWRFVSIVVCVLILLGSVARTAELVPVGVQKQLLVDDYVIADKENISRELGMVQKRGVVMKASLPTDFHPTKAFPDGLPQEGPQALGYRLAVAWNDRDGKFQMIYRTCRENLTGYAESKDGIHWTKPLISADGRSNLITYGGKTQGTFHEATFMIDPTVSWGHPEKYKAAFNPGNTMCAMAHSPDGIHWTGYNDGDSVTGRAADTQNQILWDPIAGRYLLVTRTDLGAEGGAHEVRAARIMAHIKDNDLQNHPESWETLATIAVDDPKGEETPLGAAVLQMENMDVWIYENIYFGLMHVLKIGEFTGGYGGERKVADPDARHETDVIDFYIGTSRNGADFDMSWVHAREPFIERGGHGEFDKDMLHPAPEIVNRGDEHWIYYGGMYFQHASPDEAKTRGGKVGLATLPMDRFIGQAANGRGTITTKPFKLKGSTLQVNVSAKSGDFLVEVLDEESRPIRGYAAEDAESYIGIDELSLTPRWKIHGDMSKLMGRVVKLRFHLRDARLFAFQVMP